MMKKLLVLMFVLAIGSWASAGFTFEHAADDAMVANLIGDEVMAAYYLTADKAIELSMVYTGGLANIIDRKGEYDEFFPGAAVIYEVAFADNQIPPALPAGIVMKIRALEAGETIVHLHDFDSASVLQSIVIPEPMSMLLLGLGGLFLRRRK